MERNALFITFEGPEGAGKSTQLNLLKDYLTGLGHNVTVTREPGGTPLAEEFRGIVKHYQGEEPLYPATELLLFEAARAQHVNYVIKPALAAGNIVLCDRFTDSTEAYQGAGRSLDNAFLQKLNICIRKIIKHSRRCARRLTCKRAYRNGSCEIPHYILR